MNRRRRKHDPCLARLRRSIVAATTYGDLTAAIQFLGSAEYEKLKLGSAMLKAASLISGRTMWPRDAAIAEAAESPEPIR